MLFTIGLVHGLNINNMKIETYCLANNEEKMMPYFMRHYTQFSHVILLENGSTDRTVEIAASYGADIWKFDREDEINDQWFSDIKNTCWKESTADWVIICDADEFIYHPNLVSILENTDSTIFMPRLFNMFSENFPTTEGQIYEEVTMGKEGGGKMNLFNPKEITDINFNHGCHKASPEGNVKLCVNSEIITMHFRFIGKEFTIERNIRAASRLSSFNKELGLGYHVIGTPEEITKNIEAEMLNLIKVI